LQDQGQITMQTRRSKAINKCPTVSFGRH